MASRDHEDHIARNVALAGGAALLVWLLLRGKGWGLGDGDGNGAGGGGGTGTTSTTPTPSTPAPAPKPLSWCEVKIRGDGLLVDGTTADLPTVVARCRAAGLARVSATGAAITGTIGDVVRALQAAGVGVYAMPDVWNALPLTERKP